MDLYFNLLNNCKKLGVFYYKENTDSLLKWSKNNLNKAKRLYKISLFSLITGSVIFLILTFIKNKSIISLIIPIIFTIMICLLLNLLHYMANINNNELIEKINNLYNSNDESYGLDFNKVVYDKRAFKADCEKYTINLELAKNKIKGFEYEKNDSELNSIVDTMNKLMILMIVLFSIVIIVFTYKSTISVYAIYTSLFMVIFNSFNMNIKKELDLKLNSYLKDEVESFDNDIKYTLLKYFKKDRDFDVRLKVLNVYTRLYEKYNQNNIIRESDIVECTNTLIHYGDLLKNELDKLNIINNSSYGDNINYINKYIDIFTNTTPEDLVDSLEIYIAKLYKDTISFNKHNVEISYPIHGLSKKVLTEFVEAYI